MAKKKKQLTSDSLKTLIVETGLTSVEITSFIQTKTGLEESDIEQMEDGLTTLIKFLKEFSFDELVKFVGEHDIKFFRSLIKAISSTVTPAINVGPDSKEVDFLKLIFWVFVYVLIKAFSDTPSTIKGHATLIEILLDVEKFIEENPKLFEDLTDVYVLYNSGCYCCCRKKQRFEEKKLLLEEVFSESFSEMKTISYSRLKK